MENAIAFIVVISMILPVIYGLSFHIRYKKENEVEHHAEVVVKKKNSRAILYLVLMIISIIAMIVECVLYFTYATPKRTSDFVILEIATFAYFLFCLLFFAKTKYNCYVVTYHGVYEKRLFSKTKLIKYSSIKYMYRSYPKLKYIVCYDAYRVPLIQFNAKYVGAKEFYQKLRSMNYKLFPGYHPQNDMIKSSAFKKFLKRGAITIASILCPFFAIASLLIGYHNCSVAVMPEYTNYEVTGIVEKHLELASSIKIYLKNDNATYYINTAVYSELNPLLLDDLKEDTEITLYVAYRDVYDRYNISQVEINNYLYLDMESSESAEYSYYMQVLTKGYIAVILGVSLEIVSYILWLGVKRVREKENY